MSNWFWRYHSTEFSKYGSTINPQADVGKKRATHDSECENWLKSKLRELYAPQLKRICCDEDSDCPE
jgi:hypothetical protein